jgi:polyferredoxin
MFFLSFFIRRFWCRLCPSGALLALFNKGCLTTKEKDLQKCSKCGICYDVCPVDNEDVFMIKDRKVVNGTNCIMCFECVDKCPENDCLKVKFAGKTLMRSKFDDKLLK